MWFVTFSEYNYFLSKIHQIRTNLTESSKYIHFIKLKGRITKSMIIINLNGNYSIWSHPHRVEKSKIWIVCSYFVWIVWSYFVWICIIKIRYLDQGHLGIIMKVHKIFRKSKYAKCAWLFEKLLFYVFHDTFFSNKKFRKDYILGLRSKPQGSNYTCHNCQHASCISSPRQQH